MNRRNVVQPAGLKDAPGADDHRGGPRGAAREGQAAARRAGGVTAPAKTRAEREAARHVERVERAIVAARAVAATPEAAELQRRTGGKHGAWTAEDERRLREGVIVTPGGPYRLRGAP